jgi:hypothetical protein
VSFFTAPHDIATQVTVSFVNLLDRRPAVGYIRADQAPDLKRYSELLEENLQLRDDIAKLMSPNLVPFQGAAEGITLVVEVGRVMRGAKLEKVDETREKAFTVGQLFVKIAEIIVSGNNTDYGISNGIRKEIYDGYGMVQWAEGSPEFARILLILYGKELVDFAHTIELDSAGKRDELRRWKLTDYGQRQYGLLMAP